MAEEKQNQDIKINPNSVLPPAISAGSNLIGAGLQQIFYKRNADYNQKLQQENLKFQWENAIPETVNSMRAAGLNVGLANSNGGPSVSSSMGAGSVPIPSNPLTGVGELINQANLAKADVDIKKIIADNLQREYDDRHWQSVSDIQLIEDTISDRKMQRSIAISQLTLDREKFDFEMLMRNDENTRQWMSAYQQECSFMLDAYKKAFENEHLQERYDAELRNLNAYTSEMLASAKSLLDNVELRKNELSLQEREMVAQFNLEYTKLSDLNTRVQNQLDFDKEKWKDTKQQFNDRLEFEYVNSALRFSEGVLDDAINAFNKFLPSKTITETVKRGNKTTTKTSSSR